MAGQKKKISKVRKIALTGSFDDKLAAWTSIVDAAVGATTVATAKKACAKAEALDHIPVDLWNEDDCDARALTKAHAAWNAKLEQRIRALGQKRELISLLCNLRDLINDS